MPPVRWSYSVEDLSEFTDDHSATFKFYRSDSRRQWSRNSWDHGYDEASARDFIEYLNQRWRDHV